MAYDGKILARARTELEKIKNANREETLRRHELVYFRVPRIQEINSLMRGQMSELVRMTVSKSRVRRRRRKGKNESC